MKYRKTRGTAALWVALAVCGLAHADRAKSKADAWIGKDASELLLQLRVDGGQVDIQEDDATGETRYTWSTWNPAWVETRVSGGGLSYGSGAPGSTLVGVTPGGNGVAGAPIYQAPSQVDYVQHAATHRCDVTFFANADGIVERWEFTGAACGRDIRAPKN